MNQPISRREAITQSLAAGVSLSLTACAKASEPEVAEPHAAPRYPLGVGLEGIGGRGLEFVDVMKTLRPWEGANGGPVQTDAQGWPLSDARSVAFDMRPAMAWAPPMDDPDAYQIDVSGTYSLSFVGKASVSAHSDPGGATVTDMKHDSATSTSTAKVNLAKGAGLLVLTFTGTQGGVKNVKLIRPGYPVDTKQVFHTPFLKALAPFPVLRFMDWLDTNGNNLFYGDPPPRNQLSWANRRLPVDATQNAGTKHGVAWEYVVALANETKKDIWINIPAPASDDYVRKLAEMLKQQVNANSAIYVEYSNEVWNWGFIQATYNKMAAEADGKQAGSKLADDGKNDMESLRRRRHARRSIEITKIFGEVFGAVEINKRIKPVLAWWAIFPDQYADMLAWVQRNYGAPSKLFTGIAMAPYFNGEKASKTASVDQVLDAMQAASDGWRKMRTDFIAIAKQYNLKPMCYEGGADNGGGDPANVGNRIRANRHPRMGELVRRDLKDNWFDLGGDLFMYFTLSSAYSRYGCWGLTEDITKLDTPKYKAATSLLKVS